MEKTKFKIGEVFQCGLVKLKCVEYEGEGNPCDDCYFGWECKDMVGDCSESSREDKSNVIFVKAED